MDALLSLPEEIQIIVISGYISYKISTVGKSVEHRTEDFIFQIFVFGSLSRIIAIWSLKIPFLNEYHEDFGFIASISIIIGILIACFWRHSGKYYWSRLMGMTGVFQDDLEWSAWDSITQTRSTWNYVQIFCKNGSIYESDFDALPESIPTKKIILAKDAVCIYVAAKYDKNHSKEENDPNILDRGYVIDYIPRDNIEKISICWNK